MTDQSFLVKTKGWLLNALSYGEVVENAHYSTWTANHRFAWVEYNKMELTGIAAAREVCIPQGWSIQEAHAPEGYCQGKYIVDKEGMPQYIEIHDLWCTQILTNDMLGTIVGRLANALVLPSFLPYNYINRLSQVEAVGFGSGHRK